MLNVNSLTITKKRKHAKILILSLLNDLSSYGINLLNLIDDKKHQLMASVDKQVVGLNDVQLSLLRMFNRKMSYEESVEIRDLLVQSCTALLKQAKK